MTAPFPTFEVEQPALVEPAIGMLLATFDPVPTSDEHWELGYHFPTWGSCLSAFRWGPCSGNLREHGSGSTTVTTVPIQVYAPFRCSTFGTGGDLSEYEAAAKQALTVAGSQQLEAELWDGALAIQNAWPNLYLASATSTDVGGGNTYPARTALALLQKALRACIGEDSGVIHASPALVSLWQQNRGVQDVDGKLRDLFGNYVIAGAGYTGGGVVSDAVYTLTSTAAGGTFTLSVTSPLDGTIETTAPIAWNASANDVLAALEALTIVDPGDVVSATGGALATNPVVVTFGGRFVLQTVAVTQNTTLLIGGAQTLVGSGGGSVVPTGAEWAYATGRMAVRVGKVEVIDPENGHSIDRATNTIELYAQATMSATWDGCCHYRVKAQIPASV